MPDAPAPDPGSRPTGAGAGGGGSLTLVGIGVIPDIEVRPTARDVGAGRDVVFERGLVEVKRLLAR